MRKWEDLSLRRRVFIMSLCVVVFFTFIFGFVYVVERNAKLEEERLKKLASVEEARMGAKKGSSRMGVTAPVLDYEFIHRWWWTDKVILKANMHGDIIEYHEYYLFEITVHVSDTLECAHLAFKEKLEWERAGGWSNKPTKLIWKKQMPPNGKIHLFIPRKCS